MQTSKTIILATSTYIRISSFKVNLILNKIRGQSYIDALKILANLSQKSSTLVWKTLYSAVCDAKENFGLLSDELFVCEAFANQGPMLKRLRHRAKGETYMIQKKMSHITVGVWTSRSLKNKKRK